MKKKTLKKVVVILMVLIQLVIISNSVLGGTTTQAPQGTTQANTIATLDGNIDTSSKAARTIIGVSKTLLELLQLIGIAVGLIMLVIIGIRFILKSDKEKPDFKNVAMNYIFGAICIFGATTILTFIQKIAIQFKNAV